MSAHKLSNDFSTSLEEADAIINAYFDAYPGIKKFLEESKKISFKRGYIQIDRFGRKAFLRRSLGRLKTLDKKIKELKLFGKKVPKKLYSEAGTLRGKLERRACNYRIQGTAATISKLAGILLYKHQMLTNSFDKFELVNSVHDELVYLCKNEHLDEVSKLVESNMEKAGSIACPGIHFAVDVEISNHWAK